VHQRAALFWPAKSGFEWVAVFVDEAAQPLTHPIAAAQSRARMTGDCSWYENMPDKSVDPLRTQQFVSRVLTRSRTGAQSLEANVNSLLTPTENG